MGIKYFVTGAAGHLGMNVLNELVKRKYQIRAFVMPGEDVSHLPKNIEICYGNVLNLSDIDNFLNIKDNCEHIVIHLAGIVSIKSKYDINVYNVNVNGTKNIVDKCIEYKVKKLVYISSVHAIKENENKKIIKETDDFNPNYVKGLYAKTKAEASKYVIEHKDELNVTIIHPSGILGPYDYAHSHLMALLKDYYNGRLTAAVNGGYDFVDARDVAYAIVEASFIYDSGSCYIVSNKYTSVKELLDIAANYTGHKKIKTYLPLIFAKLTAPLAELYYKIVKSPPLFTKYSLYTLESNSNFSHEKATKELNYHPRDIKVTIKDSIEFLKSIGKIK